MHRHILYNFHLKRIVVDVFVFDQELSGGQRVPIWAEDIQQSGPAGLPLHDVHPGAGGQRGHGHLQVEGVWGADPQAHRRHVGFVLGVEVSVEVAVVDEPQPDECRVLADNSGGENTNNQCLS